MKKSFLLLTAMLLCYCGTAFGWGKSGHDAIAYIAECNLTPKARKNIEKYLDGRSIVYYASWMDLYRHTPAYKVTSGWHGDMVDADGKYVPNAKGDAVQCIEEAIARLNRAGYLVIVITNQSGLNRGYFDLATLDAIHSKLRRTVEAGGGRIDDIFYCPHRPDENCSCRKPEIGMGLAAMARYGIDPSRSWMVGDSDSDMEFGRRLGCRTFRVGGGVSFSDAVDGILRGRSSENVYIHRFACACEH